MTKLKKKNFTAFKKTVKSNKNSFLKKRFISASSFKLERLYTLRKNISLLKNQYFKWHQSLRVTKNYIVIKITPNNTLLTLTDMKGNVNLKMSAGKLGLHSSKKNYRIIYNLVLNEFLKLLKKEKKKRNIIFKITAPKLIKKRLIRRLKYFLNAKHGNKFELIRRLPFNGCRPPKIRRKKRKGLRIFKPII